MSPTPNSPDLSSTSVISCHAQMGRENESARFIPLASHGYFWDVEEFRHQERLHRVSHAQYLYRHRHDSSEAAKMYRSFIEEQNQWMDEQERMKEMEARLSARAYQQRASRWEEEWRRLEEGRKVEDILKRTGAIQFTEALFQRGFGSLSFSDGDENQLSDLVMSPQTISTLHLPGPLLSIPGPSSLIFSAASIQQVDGAHHSKDKDCSLAPRNPGILKHEKRLGDNQPQSITNALGEPRNTTEPHNDSRPTGSSRNADMRLRSSPNKLQIKREEMTETEGSILSLNSSPLNTSPVISAHQKDRREQCHVISMAAGEVLRIIGHDISRKKNPLYLVLWKPHNSGDLSELWIRAVDFLGKRNKVILEDYHLRQNLGPVRWPRDPRRQWRSSTSFGVQELKSALDERKKVLLDRGVSELEASRKMSEERWKMRADWQRAGRGWGSALIIVQNRKKAWEIADSNSREIQKCPDENSPDLAAMMKNAGEINPDMYRQEHERSLQSYKQFNNPNHSENAVEVPGPQFRVTSEDEREWREHFRPGLITDKMLKSSGLSRVKSTLHLPNDTTPELVRAATLPELRERIAKFRELPKNRHQGAAKLPISKSLESVNSTLSEAQSHLKAQRKKLLSRMLSRGPLKRETLKNPELTRTARRYNEPMKRVTEGSQQQTVFLESETQPRPFRRSDNHAPRNIPGQPIATPRSSSYVSFDGANSNFVTLVRESWTKRLWGKFSHLLVSSSRASMRSRKSKGAGKSRITVKGSGGKMRVAPMGAEKTQNKQGTVFTAGPGTVEVGRIGTPSKVITDNPESSQHEAHKKENPFKVFSPSVDTEALVTAENRTALWAASVSPILRKENPEEPEKAKSVPSSADEADIMFFTPSQSNTETAEEEASLNQLSLEIISEANSKVHRKGNSQTMNKGKERAKLMLDTHVSSSPQSLTRTQSQQQYLADREAERKIRRDRNVLKTKIKIMKIKQKADQEAEQLKRLDRLHSKKACPFGKWSKRDQIELELLRIELGLRGAKNSFKRGDLRKLETTDLQKLREAFLHVPSKTVARRQPKGRSPV